MLFHTVFRVLIVTAYVGEKLVTTKRCCYGVGLCRSDSRYGHREHIHAVPKASHEPRQMLALDNSVQTGWFWGRSCFGADKVTKHRTYSLHFIEEAVKMSNTQIPSTQMLHKLK